jgi:hypothetical protein
MYIIHIFLILYTLISVSNYYIANAVIQENCPARPVTSTTFCLLDEQYWSEPYCHGQKHNLDATKPY